MYGQAHGHLRYQRREKEQRGPEPSGLCDQRGAQLYREARPPDPERRRGEQERSGQDGGTAQTQPGRADGAAGRPGGSGRGEKGRKEPGEPDEGAKAPAGKWSARAAHVPAHGVHGQSRHRQDHRGPTHQRPVCRHRRSEQGPAGGGGPLRPGGRLCGPDGLKDPGGHQIRSGRRAVHRRGLFPVLRRRKRLRPGGN